MIFSIRSQRTRLLRTQSSTGRVTATMAHTAQPATARDATSMFFKTKRRDRRIETLQTRAPLNKAPGKRPAQCLTCGHDHWCWECQGVCRWCGQRHNGEPCQTRRYRWYRTRTSRAPPHVRQRLAELVKSEPKLAHPHSQQPVDNQSGISPQIQPADQPAVVAAAAAAAATPVQTSAPSPAKIPPASPIPSDDDAVNDAALKEAARVMFKARAKYRKSCRELELLEHMVKSGRAAVEAAEAEVARFLALTQVRSEARPELPAKRRRCTSV